MVSKRKCVLTLMCVIAVGVSCARHSRPDTARTDAATSAFLQKTENAAEVEVRRFVHGQDERWRRVAIVRDVQVINKLRGAMRFEPEEGTVSFYGSQFEFVFLVDSEPVVRVEYSPYHRRASCDLWPSDFRVAPTAEAFLEGVLAVLEGLEARLIMPAASDGCAPCCGPAGCARTVE